VVSGTPVVFAQRVHDSRIRLLKDIGLRIHNPYSADILPLARGILKGQVVPPSDIFGKVSALKERYLTFIADFRRRVSRLQPRSDQRRVV
jgi:hypothetical protein